MKKNVGGIDRIFRIVAGLALIIWGYITQNMLGVIGLVPLFTAAIGWCPAYLPLGLNTCNLKDVRDRP